MIDLDQYIHNMGSGIRDMSVEQRTYLKDEVVRRAPCNFLVWGVGLDSQLWQLCNEGGTTVFLEDKKKWIDRVTAMYDSLDIVRVRFSTRRLYWRGLLDQPEKLELRFPERVTQPKWDVIFVDAPVSWASWHHGRMQSIYMSRWLTRHHGGVDVFVHDIHRRVERAYADRFLGSENLVRTLGNLAHYSI